MLPTSHTFQQAKFLKPGKIVFYTIFCNIRKVLAYLLSGYTFGCSFKNNSIAYCCSVSFWVVFWSLWLVALFGYSSLKMSIYQKHHSGIQVWRSHHSYTFNTTFSCLNLTRAEEHIGNIRSVRLPSV